MFYSRFTNLSMMCMVSSCIVLGAENSSSSASVSSGKTFQMVQAVFLPCPVKLDTVSHHTKAWNIGSFFPYWLQFHGLRDIRTFSHFQTPNIAEVDVRYKDVLCITSDEVDFSI